MGMLSRTGRGVAPSARAESSATRAADTADRFYRHLAQAVCAGYLVTTIGICASAALFLLHSRDERIEASTAQALTLTRALDEHVRRTLSGVDIVLGVVAADIVAHGGVDRIPELELHDELKGKLALLPQASSMFVYRSDLQLHAGSGFYPVPRVDGSQLMHVSAHLSPTSSALLVSKPLMSPVAKRWTIPATRRITGADGTLIGVVGAAIDTSHFDAFYRELDLAPDMGLALMRDSGELLFRFPQMTRSPPGTDLLETSPVFGLPLPLQRPSHCATTTTRRRRALHHLSPRRRPRSDGGGITRCATAAGAVAARCDCADGRRRRCTGRADAAAGGSVGADPPPCGL